MFPSPPSRAALRLLCPFVACPPPPTSDLGPPALFPKIAGSLDCWIFGPSMFDVRCFPLPESISPIPLPFIPLPPVPCPDFRLPPQGFFLVGTGIFTEAGVRDFPRLSCQPINPAYAVSHRPDASRKPETLDRKTTDVALPNGDPPTRSSLLLPR